MRLGSISKMYHLQESRGTGRRGGGGAHSLCAGEGQVNNLLGSRIVEEKWSEELALAVNGVTWAGGRVVLVERVTYRWPSV